MPRELSGHLTGRPQLLCPWKEVQALCAGSGTHHIGEQDSECGDTACRKTG
jgi:hypothetical protein